MQRRLGLYLAIFASGVLVFSALQPSRESVLTLRQAYVNLAVAVVASLILVWPFSDLVQVFCGILRFTAPVTALLFLARGRWAYLPPLLLLGLVFHGCAWVAEEMKAGRGVSGMWRDLRYLASRLGGRPAPGISPDGATDGSGSDQGRDPQRPRRAARGRPTPFDPDDDQPPTSGTFIVRGPEEAPAGPPPEQAPSGGRTSEGFPPEDTGTPPA